jgi:hypothetical protein
MIQNELRPGRLCLDTLKESREVSAGADFEHQMNMCQCAENPVAAYLRLPFGT